MCSRESDTRMYAYIRIKSLRLFPNPPRKMRFFRAKGKKNQPSSGFRLQLCLFQLQILKIHHYCNACSRRPGATHLLTPHFKAECLLMLFMPWVSLECMPSRSLCYPPVYLLACYSCLLSRSTYLPTSPLSIDLDKFIILSLRLPNCWSVSTTHL